MQRWALTLSAYHYDIQFKPKAQHGNADGLSRLLLPSVRVKEEMSETAAAYIINFKQINKLPVTAARLKEETASNPVLSKVLRYPQRRWPKSIDAKLRPFLVNKEELTVDSACLFRGFRLVIPPSLQPDIKKELHTSRLGIVRMKGLARLYVRWPGTDRQIEQVVGDCAGCQLNRQAPRVASLHSWAWPTRQREKIHIDLHDLSSAACFLSLLMPFQTA